MSSNEVPHDPITGEILSPVDPPNPYAIRDVPAILRTLEDGAFLERLDEELKKVLGAIATGFAKEKNLTAAMTIKLDFIGQVDMDLVKIFGDVSVRLPPKPKQKSGLFLSSDATHLSRVHPRQIGLPFGPRAVGGAPVEIRTAAASPTEVRSAGDARPEIRAS